MQDDERSRTRQAIDAERLELLEQLQDWLEWPMLVLAFLWLTLFVVETLWGLSPLLEVLGYVIWGVFVLESVLGFVLAPSKMAYLRRNWLKVISLLAPALRTLRIVGLVRLSRASRLAGMSRGLRLLRLLSSLNRGMRALGKSMERRGLGYVILLTLIIALVGAAGMYGFERDGMDSYGEAVWWTVMILVTLGTDYWPRTVEGRTLYLFLALYGFGVFGYVTATLATFFIGRDAEAPDTETVGRADIRALREEIAALRDELRQRNE
jgi:voltage-gated potassium channel